jgi:hypothetical protein
MTTRRYTPPPTKNLYPRTTYRTSSSDPANDALNLIGKILIIVALVGIAYFAHSLGAF